MLQKLRRQVIWKLKRLPVLVTADTADLKNRWEEFCWHYYGDSVMMELWDDYMIAEISTPFEKLKEIDRFKAWLETPEGLYAVDKFMDKEFEAIIPVEYLNINRSCREMGYDDDDVYIEVYSLIKGAATDYAIDHNW